MTSFQRRFDIANDVIHFTKGESPQDAFDVLAKIVAEERLLGGNGYIRGGYRCVCFTEAPLAHLAEVFAQTASTRLRYMPFGVLLPKRWLFERGGRPVVYQADPEFEALPESLRYRHVRYEPSAEPPVDFTWEREWRIQVDELELDPSIGFLVLPGEEHLAELKRRHDAREDAAYHTHCLQVPEHEAAQMRRPFLWNSMLLEPPSLPRFRLATKPSAV